MSYQRVRVVAYSGYRGEESPRAIILNGKKIEVVKTLKMWIRGGTEDRSRKRFFKVEGSDGAVHEVYYDEREMEWFYKSED